MAAGAVSFKLTDIHINEVGTQVEVSVNVTKWLEDDDGAQNSIGSWTGRLSYAKAGFGSRTLASVRSDMIAEVKAKNSALSGKAVS